MVTNESLLVYEILDHVNNYSEDKLIDEIKSFQNTKNNIVSEIANKVTNITEINRQIYALISILVLDEKPIILKRIYKLENIIKSLLKKSNEFELSSLTDNLRLIKDKVANFKSNLPTSYLYCTNSRLDDDKNILKEYESEIIYSDKKIKFYIQEQGK